MIKRLILKWSQRAHKDDCRSLTDLCHIQALFLKPRASRDVAIGGDLTDTQVVVGEDLPASLG